MEFDVEKTQELARQLYAFEKISAAFVSTMLLVIKERAANNGLSDKEASLRAIGAEHGEAVTTIYQQLKKYVRMV